MRSPKRRASADEIVGAPVDEHAVVDVGHWVPVESPAGNVVEHLTHHRFGFVNLADVVHADVPFVTGAMKHVREAARRVVALQHQDPLAGVFGEQRGGGEAPDAGTDHDGVIVFGAGWLLTVRAEC